MSIFGGGGKSAATTPTRAMGLDLQSAQYGSPIPVIFGQNKVAGNVIWYGDFKAIGHQQKQPGKGGGGGSSGTTYTYSSSYMLGLCEGVASIVNVYDGSSVKSLSSVGGIGFTGTLGQAPWAHLSGAQALGYSGTALAAFQNKDLGSSASLPNYNFEVAARNQFGGGILDANPADIVTGICVDAQIGVNFNALGDLTQYRTYCTAAGLFFSPAYATQQAATQTLDDLFKYSNSAPYFSEGVLKVVPYGDAMITGNGSTFTPNVTAVADLGRDDFITNGPGDPVTIKRIGPADAMNIVRVEYKDRANTYHTSTVIASIDQDVVGTGARADQSESVDMITTAAVARLVSQNLLQRIYYIRNTYEFQLSWRYCYLEPMDVVTLTDANTGLYLTPVRITEISEDEHGLLSIVAEEFPDGVSHGGIYATQANAGATVDTNADPGAVDGPYLFRGPGFLVSNNQPEIWCALSGNDPMWAGCDVYLSHDGTSYTYLATHSRRASYGVTTNALASHADPDTAGAPNVVLNGPAQLLGGTMGDADQFITLAMLDNEIISYQTATLAGGPSYTLGYLRRGGYGSAIAAHAVNAPFVRLDENILRIPVDPSQIGQTVYLKFVSFNVFGKGGRTLADETAYTYVIGTNVELPDVPITPASFTATGVADGVSLTWTNPNPAAVGCTSIEYATASGGPWTVLAQVGPTTTAYVHHFTNGATYFYRARSRGPLIAAGFSAYTATVTNTGTNVGAISNAANAAQNSAPIINPNFGVGDLTGWTSDFGTWSFQSGTAGPETGTSTYAIRTGSSGTPTDTLRNLGKIKVYPGAVIKAACSIRGAGGANGTCSCLISWRNSSNAEILVTQGNVVTGNTLAASFAVGTAPAGAIMAHIEAAAISHTTGTYTVDGFIAPILPDSLDQVPDGGTKFGSIHAPAVQAGMFGPGQNMLANPTGAAGNLHWGSVIGSATAPEYAIDGYRWKGSASGDQGRVADNIGCGAGASLVLSADIYASSITGGIPGIFISYRNASNAQISLDSVVATASTGWARYSLPVTTPAGTVAVQIYMRANPTGGGTPFWRNFKLESGTVATPFSDTATQDGNQLTNAGSGATLGNQYNAPNSLTMTYGAAQSTTSLSATTAGAVSVAAFTIYTGSASASYNAVANAITGLTATQKYYVYCHDAGGKGGTKTWFAATSVQAAMQQGDDVVFAGAITIPASGTGTGGGSTGCPVREAWVIRKTAGGREYCRARDVAVGDELQLTDGRWGYVSYSQAKLQPCVRVTGQCGKSLSCSESAPLGALAGGSVLASDACGHDLRILRDIPGTAERVASVENIGQQWVQHITCENDYFWTGDEQDCLFSHHNMKPP